MKFIASDPLSNPRNEDDSDYHLRSSGFAIQDEVSEKWKQKLSSEDIAKFIWDNSDLGERMWGSSQWKSRVLVSEAVIPVDERGKWGELLFQNVAINRFTGGAAEQKLFNALAVTHATFEGSITVFGDELWMIGLTALLFKDLTDGLIRAGSGKTRGRGAFKGWLEQIELKALPGSKIAETCGFQQAEENQVWIARIAESEQLQPFPQKVDGWLKNLLEQGVTELNERVKASGEREADSEHHHSS